MPHKPAGAGCMTPPMSPCPWVMISMNARRSRLSAMARRRSGLSKGGLSRLMSRLRLMLPGVSSHIASGSWLCASSKSGTVRLYEKVMSNFPATNPQYRRREIADDRILDAVEIRPALLPVIRVLCHLDVFVGLELNEFKRAGADRMAAHIARRHVAGIDRREPRGEQRDKSRLRPLQMKGDFVITIGGHTAEVPVPRFAGIYA